MELLILIIAVILRCLLSPGNNSGNKGNTGGLTSIEKYKTFESIHKK